MYAFGQGMSGQLGIKTPLNCNLPQVVVGPWVSPHGMSLQETDESVPKIYIQAVSMKTASRLYRELSHVITFVCGIWPSASKEGITHTCMKNAYKNGHHG